MGKPLCYFLFMLWFSYLIVSSILLFTRGFLLTRITQKLNSTCVSHSEIPCLFRETSIINVTNGHEDQCSETDKVTYILNNINSASSICLPQKSKVVLLIIDALRYDFALYDDKINNPLPFQNKLPIVNELRNKYPNSTRLFKFIADPPTTTMQRLKALTTGSLPTFIDAGSNFATYEINEDNIIDQLIRNNHSIVFMGDDTWNGLYPNRFLRNYPFPSFNVWDLDTVDKGVNSKIFGELHKSDWSLLVGHYLGVDHCGHRFGPNHPEMARKLTELNSIIKKIVNEIESDTILFVLGDHGMTVTGDHGGESEDEVTSALFVFSHQPLSSFAETSDTVKQVDLIPTVSTILGVPIPFSSLGTLILDSLPLIDNSSQFKNWELLLFSLWSNVQQMMTYIKEYSRNSDIFNEDILQSFNEKYSILSSRILTISDEGDFNQFAADAIEFMINLRTMCEEVWVQFDSFSMTRGLLFLFLSMFFVYMITDGIPNNRLPEIFMSSFLFCSYLSMFGAAAFSAILYYFHYVDNLLSTIFFSTGIISQFMLVMMVIQNWELISLNWYDRSKREKIPNLICRLVLIFNLCGLFSNSFIIEESFVLLFLLNTVIIIGTFTIIYNEPKKNCLKWPKFKFLLFAFAILALVKFSKYFWRCREEQQWCFASPHDVFAVPKIETTKLQWTLTVICLALFITVTRIWLRNCGNLNGYKICVTFAKYAPTVLVVCISGFWVLNRSSLEMKNRAVKFWQTKMLAWVVYILTSLGIVSIIQQPLCIYVLPNKKEVTIQSDNNIIPQLFKHVRGLFNEKKSNQDSIPIVCGLGTVYSSVYIIVAVYLILLFTLLLGDAVAPSAVIMFLAAVFILIVTSVIRLEVATSIEQLFEIPNMSVLVWVILSQYFFYGSGHQPTFPNIAWQAAFIGTSENFTNNVIPGALIIINTFCSNILMGFLVPLIVVAPFTISLMLPNAMTKKSVLQKENLRGEILLYEHDKLMITSVFTMSCKYVTCHGIRVFANMLAATIHCRHLMVWKIFAPKLIFEAVGMMITLLSVVLGYLLLIRINNQVNKLVASLNKQWS